MPPSSSPFGSAVRRPAPSPGQRPTMVQTTLSWGPPSTCPTMQSLPSRSTPGSDDLPIVTSDIIKPRGPRRSYGAFPADRRPGVLTTPQPVRRLILDANMKMNLDMMQEDELAERPKKRRVVSPPSLEMVSPRVKEDSAMVDRKRMASQKREQTETVVSIPVTSKEYYQQFQDCSREYRRTERTSATRGRGRSQTMDRVGRPRKDFMSLIDLDLEPTAEQTWGSHGPNRGRSRVIRETSQDDDQTLAPVPMPKNRKPPKQRTDTAVRSRGKRRARFTRPWHLFMSLRPKYMEFVCEWKECPAKLFNMETMRRHVEIVHVRKAEKTLQKEMSSGTGDGMIRCFWENCCGSSPATVSSIPGSPGGKKFVSGKALRLHIEEAHMIPMSWHMGDGPKHDPDNPGPEILNKNAPLPDYLFGADGVQITPDIRGQAVESETSKKARQTRLRKLWAQIEAGLPSEEEERGDGESFKMED